MKEFDTKELKRFQCEMLSIIAEYCEKEHLTCFLAYGTLIGSVRHNGYIPWDDDIDLMMPRPDYDQLLESFNGTFEHLVLGAPELDGNFYSPFANIWDNRTKLEEFGISHRGYDIGVKIDIFPLDGVPEDYLQYKRMVRKSRLLNEILEIKRTKINVFSNNLSRLKFLTKYLLYCPFSYSYIQKQIIKLRSMCDYEKSKYVDIIIWPVYSYKRFDKQCVNSSIEGFFEGYSFLIPRGYDSVLSCIYGDYMKLPPEEKRVTHHAFKAFWK